jgi:hypothetical protein
MEDVGIFQGHLVHFMAIWYILFDLILTKMGLAILWAIFLLLACLQWFYVWPVYGRSVYTHPIE